LRVAHKSQVSEYKVIRRISVTKREEIPEHFKISCEEELHDLYKSANIVTTA
jgi:hypothetical protein